MSSAISREPIPPICRRLPATLSIRRAPGKLKYLAGTESGMGVWINDIAPEEAAERLREVGS